MSGYSTRLAASLRAAKEKRLRQAEEVSAYYAAILERNVQKIIVDFLEKAQIPYMRNRDVKLVKRADGSLVPARLSESQRGKPDLTVVGLAGASIWIETKAPKGEHRPEQVVWRDRLVARGHEYHSPRTPEEAEAVCRRILEVCR